MNELEQEAISTEDQVALTAILTAQQVHHTKMDLKKEVQQLRDDHLAVVDDLDKVKGRVSKLEDLVRALTAQRNVVPEPPKMALDLEVKTRYGKTIIIRIPKGQALVPHRSVRSQGATPSEIAADSAPSSPPNNGSTTTKDGDVASSSSNPTESIVRLPKAGLEASQKVRFWLLLICADELPTDALLEQPLPPVPSATSFPVTTSTTKSGKTEPAPTQRDLWPKAATSQGTNPPVLSLWDAAGNSVFETPDAAGQSASKTKGKGKAKKWTDPPIFKDSQIAATKEDTKESFLHNVDVGTLGGALEGAGRTLKIEHAGKGPIAVKQTADQATLTNPLKPKQDTVASGPSNLGGFSLLPPKGDRLEPKQEMPFSASTNKRSFGEFTSVFQDMKSPDENRPPQAKQVQAKLGKPVPSPLLSSVGDIKSMLTSSVPTGNYIASAASRPALSNEPSAVPRANLAPSGPNVTYRITSPSGINKASESANTGRVARRSAIKKVETADSVAPTEKSSPGRSAIKKVQADDPAPSTEKSSPGKSKNVTFAAASQTPSLNIASASQRPLVSPMISPVNDGTVSPVSPVSPVRSKPMSPDAPSFRPGAFAQKDPSWKLPGRGSNTSFHASVMAKMTPEESAKFNERIKTMGL